MREPVSTDPRDRTRTRRPYSRHGLHIIRRHVMVRGLEAIDKRSSAARALFDWRKDLVADLGGEQAVTAQQRALVEIITRTMLYLNHLDAFLLQQKRLVDRKKKTVLPVLLQRQQLADSLSRHLVALGLERRAKPVQSLHEYVAQRYPARVIEPEESATDEEAQ